jgi:hypothetical protein
MELVTASGDARGPFEAGQRRSELQRGLIDEGLNARETLMQYASRRRGRERVIWRPFATHASLPLSLSLSLSFSNIVAFLKSVATRFIV